MRIEYDPKHDILNIEFISDESIAESLEFDGLIIDYSKDGRIVSVEILDAGKRTVKDPAELLGIRDITHRILDENEVPTIEGTSMKVAELVIEHIAYGWSPEELHLQHSYLTL